MTPITILISTEVSHQYLVKLVLVRIVQHLARQAVAMQNVRLVNIMQQHIRNRQHIGELLFLHAMNRVTEQLPVNSVFHLRGKFFQPARDKAARTTGKICCRVLNDTT